MFEKQKIHIYRYSLSLCQLEKQERVYDQLLARQNNQPQPPAAQQVAQLEEDRRGLMNHINAMQREVSNGKFLVRTYFGNPKLLHSETDFHDGR